MQKLQQALEEKIILTLTPRARLEALLQVMFEGIYSKRIGLLYTIYNSLELRKGMKTMSSGVANATSKQPGSTQEYEQPRYSRRDTLLTMAGVLMVMLLASLDQTIVATALPRVIAELQGFDRYTWVSTAYLLTSTVTVPIYGKLSDLVGRKPIFLFGTSHPI